MHRFNSVVFFIALFAALLAQAQPAAAQASFKIGVFDPTRISTDTAAGQRVQGELTATRDRMQQEIATQEQEINQLQQQLSQQALSLSVDRRTTLEIDIQRKLLALNTAKDLATRELQLEVAAAESKFNEKLVAVVEQIGRDEGFLLLLDAAAVAWADASVDVTSLIVERFNQMFPETGE
jgi:Skp family chaperone for outer membrane proteins